MKTFLMLCLVIITTACAQMLQTVPSGYSELKEWGIKGDVKTITQFIFKDIAEDKIKIAPKDTLNYYQKLFITYNKAGNADQIEVMRRDKNGKDVVESGIYYSYIKNDKVGYEVEDKDTISTYIYKWVTSSSYSVSIFKNKKLVTKSLYNLDKNLLIQNHSDHFYFAKGTVASHSAYHFVNDKMLESIQVTNEEENMAKIIFKNISFDFKGNPELVLKIDEYTKKPYLVFKKYAYC